MDTGDREIWRDPNGVKLKFQDGDYVRINASEPDRLQFLSGYVRGYDLFGIDDEYSAAYELHRMGHSPLQWVKEEALEKVPEQMPHTCHGEVCGICGSGSTPQGLSIFAEPPIGEESRGE